MSRPRKLTVQQVRTIKAWYAQRKSIKPANELAKEMGIAQGTLYWIGRGLIYKEIR